MPPKRQFSGKSANKPFKRSFNSYSKREDDGNGDESSFKRFKATSNAGSSSAKAPDGMKHTDDEGNAYWELGGKLRRVTVSDFNGNVLVSVREYYEKDGKQLPGKKGISLSLDQFNQLIKVLPALEEAIGQKSSTGVIRPIYTTSAKHEAPKPKAEPESDEEAENDEDDENEQKKVITEKITKGKGKDTPAKSKQKAEDSEEEEDEDEDEKADESEED